jgi:acetyl esterase/lipase
LGTWFAKGIPKLCVVDINQAISNATELNIDSTSVSIGGLSAGGQMSAVLSHFARDEAIDLKLQLLIVPAIDMRYCLLDETLNEKNCAFQSAIDLQHAPWSPLGREKWFLKYWIGDDQGRPQGKMRDQADFDPEQALKTLDDWRCTPALATRLDGLAPAHIVTAELDLERDEGEWYAERLRRVGNKVSCKRYLGVPHAFAHYNHPERGLDKSFEFIKDTCEVLKVAHASGSQATDRRVA